jgi:hypothetical protein
MPDKMKKSGVIFKKGRIKNDRLNRTIASSQRRLSGQLSKQKNCSKKKTCTNNYVKKQFS